MLGATCSHLHIRSLKHTSIHSHTTDLQCLPPTRSPTPLPRSRIIENTSPLVGSSLRHQLSFVCFSPLPAHPMMSSMSSSDRLRRFRIQFLPSHWHKNSMLALTGVPPCCILTTDLRTKIESLMTRLVQKELDSDTRTSPQCQPQ